MKSQNHEIGDLKMRKAVGIILIRKDGFVWTGKRKLGPGVRSGERNLFRCFELRHYSIITDFILKLLRYGYDKLLFKT